MLSKRNPFICLTISTRKQCILILPTPALLSTHTLHPNMTSTSPLLLLFIIADPMSPVGAGVGILSKFNSISSARARHRDDTSLPLQGSQAHSCPRGHQCVGL